MAFFHRKLYQQKPKQWGPTSQVQSSIFTNAERVGIDPGSITLAMPMWEKAGGYTLDYSKNNKTGALDNTSWDEQGVLSDADNDAVSIENAIDVVKPSGTIILQYQKTAPAAAFLYFVYVEAFTRFAFFMGGSDNYDTIYLSNQPIVSSATTNLITDGEPHTLVASWVHGASSSWNLYVDGRFITSASYNVTYAVGASDWLHLAGRDDYINRYLSGISDNYLFFDSVLSDNIIAYQYDNPYFLFHRVPPVVYSIPSTLPNVTTTGITIQSTISDPSTVVLKSISPSNLESQATIFLPSVYLSGTVCWGHDTTVDETNVRDFTGNWTGTADIVGAGDSERVLFDSGEYVESETWNVGSGQMEVLVDKYGTGKGTPVVKYKQGDSEANCNADTWHDYSAPFSCSGWIKVRIEAGTQYDYNDTITGLTINAVDGTAFIDGASAITSYADGTKTIEIIDSTGKTLTAILDSQGTIEVVGTEIASGTLTANLLYKITATTTDYFGTGLAIGDYFTSDGTETCDASNKVKVVLAPGTNGIILKESV